MPFTKVTLEDVILLRGLDAYRRSVKDKIVAHQEELKHLKNRDFAEKFGYCPTTVGDILSRRTWKNV